MALEDSQRLHNRVITDIGNTSASNDPKQIPNDANEGLIKGAEAMAAGRTLGLSPEETLSLLSRMRRPQKGATLSEDEATRRLVQSAASLSGVSDSAEVQGLGYKDEAAVDPFGQDQGQFYEYGPGDNQYKEQAIAKIKDEMLNMEDRDDKDNRRYEKGLVRLKSGVDPGDYEDLEAELEELSPRREQMTPKVALAQTLTQLKEANEANRASQRGISSVFGGGIVDLDGYAQVSGALEDDIDLGRVQRAADASIAGETVRRDSKNFNAESREASYYKAETAALQERRRLYGPGGTGVAGDANIARIRIKPSTGFEQILQKPDGIYIDEQGNTVALQGPERPALMGSNTPSNAQALNAPAPQSAIDWVAQMKPDNYEGGRVFGDYPQVDISGTTSEFADRIRGLQIGNQTLFSNASPNIRGINELQKVVDAIVRVGGEEGVKFVTKAVDKETGKLKATPSSTPGAQEVMNLLRYTPAEQERIANALFQIEASKRSGYDNDYKRAYATRGETGRFNSDITFDAPDAMPLARPEESRAQVARINPGQEIEGRDIATKLRTLSTPDSRRPFIGAVVDRKTGKQETDAGPGFKSRFVGKGVGNLPTEQIPGALRQKAVSDEKVKAERALRKAGKPVSPARIERAAEGRVDEARLASNTTKAQLTKKSAIRDN